MHHRRNKTGLSSFKASTLSPQGRVRAGPAGIEPATCGFGARFPSFIPVHARPFPICKAQFEGLCVHARSLSFIHVVVKIVVSSSER